VIGLSSAQRTYLGMILQTLAARPKWQYLGPAIPLAIMDIESGNNPNAGPNGAGRFDGLMQVIPSTAQAMATLYGIQAIPQTNPMVSIQSGIAYLDDSARSIIRFRNTLSLSVWDLMVAYNEGFGAVERGRLDPAYLAKSQGELPIIEQQMTATASLAKRASFAPSMLRAVMPLISGASEMGIYTLDLLQRGLMPLTAVVMTK
jgi:soluble lytic murein transglycosylase-like protein